MKDRKYEFANRFAFYDHSGIQQHLEDMAAQGWLVEKFGWPCRYRPIEPQRLRFAVTYYPPASAYDPAPGEGELTYREYCAQAGWTLAAASNQIQIFYTADETALELETDPVVQVENIHRATKKTLLTGQCTMIALTLVNLGLFVSRMLDDPVEMLSSMMNLSGGLCWGGVVLVSAIEIGVYYRWRRRAVAAAENGVFLPTSSIGRAGHRAGMAVWAVALLMWLTVLLSQGAGFVAASLLFMLFVAAAAIAATSGMKGLLRRKGVPGKKAHIIMGVWVVMMTFAVTVGTLVLIFLALGLGWLREPAAETYSFQGMEFEVYHDDLPLTVEELTETGGAEYSTRLQSSATPLMGQVTSRQDTRLDSPDGPQLEYTVTKVFFSPLYGLCRDTLLTKYEDWNDGAHEEDLYRYVPEDSAPWGAEEAYRLYIGSDPRSRYLVFYPDRILELSILDWPDGGLTETQMALIAEKVAGM